MILYKIESFFEWLGGLLVACMGLMICATVFMRALFGFGVPEDVVLVGEFMVAAMTLPIAAVVARNGLIKIDMLTKRLPDYWQKPLDYLTIFVGLVGMIPLTWIAWRQFYKVYLNSSVYDGPIGILAWPGKFCFFFGIALILVRLIAFGFGAKPVSPPQITDLEVE